jgi:hypothetical protein
MTSVCPCCCRWCAGTGARPALPDGEPDQCLACHGTGRAPAWAQTKYDLLHERTPS